MKYVLLTMVMLMALGTMVMAQDNDAPPVADAPQVEVKTPGEAIGRPTEDDQQAEVSGLPAEDRGMVAAFVAASVAFITGISVLGAAYAVAHIGSAAIGAASEKPEMMGRSLVFVALGEGLAVLGLAVAFVLMFTVLNRLI